MKNIFKYLSIISISFVFTSCFRDTKAVFDTLYYVEFQDAVILSPALTKTYPIQAVANGAGVLTRRINLVGRQKSAEETITFTVDPESTAKEGVHFSLDGGTAKIPANSSFGDVKVNILKAPAAAGTNVVLVLKLEGNGGDIKPNENYKKLGIRINL
jgi:hypothetical protein